MGAQDRRTFLAGVLLAACATRTAALAADFTRDGVINLAPAQIAAISDGFNPGTRWQGFLPFPAPITVNAGDVLQGTIGFGSNLLRIRDNGGGFFVVGTVEGLEQLIASADDAGPSRISQTDSLARFTDVRGPALQTGGARVGGINDDGLFIQVVVDMVSTGNEFFASGGVYRLGLVSGGPFTFDGVSLSVLSEEIGIAPRALGDVAYRTCITGETDTGPSGTRACSQIAGATAAGANSGLDNLRSVAQSADGKSVYVVAGFDDAIAHFVPDPSTGAFVYEGCITGELAATRACTEIDSASLDGVDSGLDSPQSVAVSADGKSVYTASIGDDAIARFDRDLVTGALTYLGCISGEDQSDEGACTLVASATSMGTNSGLDGLRALALSADGTSVYAVAQEDDAVVRFERNPDTGALTYQGCISGETETGPACTLIGSAASNGTDSGLDGIFALALSPDGTSLYTVSLFDDSIARFDRDPATGALTYQGCITGNSDIGPTGTDTCAAIGSASANGTSSGLDNPFAVIVSPDGKSVYVLSEDDDAVARFDRASTGVLTYQDCITGELDTGPSGTDACTPIASATEGGTNSGLDKLRSVSMSPDGRSLYVSSPADDDVARFDRDVATGALAYQGCLTGETQTGPTGTAACGQIGSATSNGMNSGLDNPQSLVVSADGLSVFTASGNDASLARFDRASEPPTTTTSTTLETSTTTVSSTTSTTVASTSTTTPTTTSSTTSTAPGSTTTSTTEPPTTSSTVTTTTSTTTSTAPPVPCQGLSGLEDIECQLNELVDLLEATSNEDLAGDKEQFLKKIKKSVRLVDRAQTANGRLATANPRHARLLLKSFIGMVGRREERDKIADELAAELIALADGARAELLPFTKR